MTPISFAREAIVSSLDIQELAPNVVHRRRVAMTENATGNETLIPAFIVRSSKEGPTVGLTAAVHGNELNGIPVIHRLIRVLNKHPLKRGAVVAVPIVNVPGYLQAQRAFEDGVDLNRTMPGKANGNESDVYAHRFLDRIVRHFDYLIDLHTASFGRVNSLYVRVDMNAPTPAKMARILTPQIIVHNPGTDGTLRSAATNLGIHAITVEVGNPQRLQPGLIRSTRLGIQEFLEHLEMLPDLSDPDNSPIVECESSFWIYTDCGGILEVPVELTQHVEAGEVVGILRNVWGDIVRQYPAPRSGVVVGKSTNPAARAGSRVLHLGVVRGT